MRSYRLQLNSKTEILQVVDSTNCRGPRFESALNLWFHLPSFEISECLLILTSHVTWSVATSFSVVRQLRTIRRSVSRSVIQSLVTSLVRSRLDYGNATFASVPPTPSSAAPVCYECSGSTRLLVIYVWPNDFVSSSTPLLESKGADWLQARYSCIKI